MIEALKPRPLTVLLFVVGLTLQLVFFSSTTFTVSLGDEPSRTVRSFGLGSPIEFETTNDQTQLNFRWLLLASNLALTYALAAICGTGMARVTRLHRPAMAYGLVALAMLAITLFTSIIISKVYWGYFFTKPPLLGEVGEIVKVQAIVPFGIEVRSNQPTFIVHTNSLSEDLVSFKKYGDDSLAERVLLELDRKKLLPDAYATTPGRLPELYPLILGSGALVESSKGYDSSWRLRGIAVDAVAKSGDRLVFLGFTGGQVSNDHYPCYELLFRGSVESQVVTYVRGQHYFYDAAGMEGFEWYVIWALLAPLGIVVGFVVFTGIAWGGQQRNRHSTQAAA